MNTNREDPFLFQAGMPHPNRKWKAEIMFPVLSVLALLVGAPEAGAGSPPRTVAANAAPLPGLEPPGAPPVSASSPSPTTLPRAWFLHGKKLTVDARHPRKALLGYVARRVYPHPTPPARLSLERAAQRILSDRSWTLSGEKVSAGGRPALRIVLTRSALNALAGRLSQEVSRHEKNGGGKTRIRRVILSGVAPKDTVFVAKSVGVAPGDPIPGASVSALPDRLYALSQLPGYSRADAVLVPSSLPGEEDLAVKAAPAARLLGSQIEVDNYGYAAMGQITVNGSLTLNDTLLTGDQWTVSASGSPFGEVFFGMDAGTLSYSAPIDLSDRLGVDMNAMSYQIGGGWSPWGHGSTVAQLVALGLSGSNYGFDGWESHTFV